MLTNTHKLRGALSQDRGRLLAYSVLGASAASLFLYAGWRNEHRQAAPEPLVEAMRPAPVPALNPYAPMVVGLGPWARTTIAQANAARQNANPANESVGSQNPSASVSVAEAETDAGVDAPLPPRRPADLKTIASRMATAPVREATLTAAPAPAPAQTDNRSFFEKIFGGAGSEPHRRPVRRPDQYGHARAIHGGRPRAPRRRRHGHL